MNPSAGTSKTIRDRRPDTRGRAGRRGSGLTLITRNCTTPTKTPPALAVFLVERYAVDPGELLIFFSGSKGFHVGLPTALWSPPPSADFHRTVRRRFAENVAELAAVTIDTGVYDRVAGFPCPELSAPEDRLAQAAACRMTNLLGLPLERIVELSREPAPFDVPTPTRHSDQAAADWQAAAELVAREGEAKALAVPPATVRRS